MKNIKVETEYIVSDIAPHNAELNNYLFKFKLGERVVFKHIGEYQKELNKDSQNIFAYNNIEMFNSNGEHLIFTIKEFGNIIDGVTLTLFNT